MNGLTIISKYLDKIYQCAFDKGNLELALDSEILSAKIHKQYPGSKMNNWEMSEYQNIMQRAREELPVFNEYFNKKKFESMEMIIKLNNSKYKLQNKLKNTDKCK